MLVENAVQIVVVRSRVAKFNLYKKKSTCLIYTSVISVKSVDLT
jgi:hypothetical protein